VIVFYVAWVRLFHGCAKYVAPRTILSKAKMGRDALLRVRERDRMIQNPIIAAIKKSTQVDNHLWLPSFRRY